MKVLYLICVSLLILALFNLPIGYYTFLRIAVTLGSIAIIVREYKEGISIWIILFGLIAILFNPIIPVYLHNKDFWMPVDIIVAILFLAKALTIQKNQS